MALVTVNTRKYFIDADEVRIEKVSNGRYAVSYEPGGHSFIVVGGVESGGAAHEWYCHHPLFFGDAWLATKSMIAAIRQGVQW
jgi:hypothetical protein